MGAASPPSVFVSYSHDSEVHAKRVLALADRLRADGIDARLDQYVAHPSEGWPRWMQRQVLECRFVLLVCTPTYRQRFDGEDTGDAGKGVKWEGLVAQQILYEAGTHNDKLVPVLFEDGGEQDVPLSLRAYTRYRLDAGYDELCRRLTEQPLTPAPPIGAMRVMPPAARPGLAPAAPGNHSPLAATPASADITDEALVDELAKVFSDADEARLVVLRAGFNAANIPSFRMPIVFWTNMVDAARNGMIAGGVKSVADAAALMYPGNRVLASYKKTLSTSALLLAASDVRKDLFAPFAMPSILVFVLDCSLENFDQRMFYSSLREIVGEEGIFVQDVARGSTKVTVGGSSVLLGRIVTRLQESASNLRLFASTFRLHELQWSAGGRHYRLLVKGEEASSYAEPVGSLKSSEKRYHVALSYPRIHDNYLREVDYFLCQRIDNQRIFFDLRYESILARPNLDTYLQNIYGQESDLVVPFFSRHYKNSTWCGLEWRVVRDMLKSRADENVMFFRFDDEPVDGLLSIDGYVDARERTPQEAAELIIGRLSLLLGGGYTG